MLEGKGAPGLHRLGWAWWWRGCGCMELHVLAAPAAAWVTVVVGQ